MDKFHWTEEQKAALQLAARYYDAYSSKVAHERGTPSAAVARLYHNVAETLRAMSNRTPAEVEDLNNDTSP